MATDYPNSIDDATTLPTVTDGVTNISAVNINRLRNAVIAIETELGINPSSTYGTVLDRVNAMDALLGLTDGYLLASEVSILDADGYFTSTDVEGALQEIGISLSTQASTAAEVSITDTDGYYVSTNVEGALAEIGIENVKTTAAELPISDVDGYYTSTNVEGALAEVGLLNIDFMSGSVATPADQTYRLITNAPFDARFLTLTTITSDGYADGYVEVDGARQGSQNTITTTESIETYSGITNGMFAGSDVDFRVLNNFSAADLDFTLAYQRGLSPALLPNSANIVLNYDADQPGAGNRPVDLGTYNAGNLSTVAGSPSYNSTGGPGNLAYWSGNASAGYSASGVAKDGVPGVTVAMVVMVTAGNTADRDLFGAANSSGGGGGAKVTGRNTPPLYYRGSNTGPLIDSGHNVGTSPWDLYIYSESQSVNEHDADVYNLGNLTPENTVRNDPHNIASTGFGTYVWLGLRPSNLAVTGWRIAQVRVWDLKVDASDFEQIAEYFKDYYGL